MSSRDNFKQAAKELFGLDSAKKDRTPLGGFVAEVDGAPQTAVREEIPVPQPEASVAEPVGEAVAEPAPQVPPAPEAGMARAPVMPPMPQAPLVHQGEVQAVENLGDYALMDTRRETSIIAKGTTIVGRIRTDGHIEVMGKVEGNVDAEGNVAVSGRITGNVRGQHLELLSAQVKGNLTAGAGVFISSDTVVIGDVAAETVVFDGRIKGNVTAGQSAEFNRNSYLVGDITTRTIAIEPGAVINGMIRTTGVDDLPDDDFDEFQIF